MELLIFLLIPLMLVTWLVLVLVFNAKTRIYGYNGHHIKVYAGFFTHYIEIDNQVVDKVKTACFFTINLKGSIGDVHVKVRIGQGLLGNTITTFINGVEARRV